MFILEKIIGGWLMPLPFCLTLLIIGLLLMSLSRWQRTAYGLLMCSIALLLIFSTGPLPYWMANRLEAQYTPLLTPPPHTQLIVVLSSGVIDDAALPTTSQLDTITLARLTEGIRLFFLAPRAKLIVSGGKVLSESAAAVNMQRAAITLGVPSQRLEIDSSSRTTEEEALNLQAVIGKEPFILVTSAIHMPRAMALFQSHGMRPIPAPANFIAKNTRWLLFLPSSNNLTIATQSLHEYLGLWWNKLNHLTL